MTYIDYINQFNRWKENSSPSDKAIILYFSLLEVFNQRRWPEWAGIATPRLMSMARTTNTKTALRARNELCDAGLIEYKPGHKGRASEYRLMKLENSVGFYGKSVIESYPQSDNPIKNIDIEVDNNGYNGNNGAIAAGDSSASVSISVPRVHKFDETISEFIDWYFNLYNQIKGIPHPMLKSAQMVRVHDTLNAFCYENDVDIVTLKGMADNFFSVSTSDHNINHFATSGILENRFYESQT